jgi:hypothetical protein
MQSFAVTRMSDISCDGKVVYGKIMLEFFNAVLRIGSPPTGIIDYAGESFPLFPYPAQSSSMSAGQPNRRMLIAGCETAGDDVVKDFSLPNNQRFLYCKTRCPHG